MFLAVEQEDLTRAIIAAIEAYARAHPGTTDEQVEDGTWKWRQSSGIAESLSYLAAAKTARAAFTALRSLCLISR